MSDDLGLTVEPKSFNFHEVGLSPPLILNQPAGAPMSTPPPNPQPPPI